MTTDSPLRSRIRTALVAARREQDRAGASTLRTALSALENAEAVPVGVLRPAGALEEAPAGQGAADVPRRTLSEAEERAVLDAEIATLVDAAEVCHDIAPERAEAARTAAALLTALR